MTDDDLGVETHWPGISAAGDWIRYDTPSLWMERASTTGIAAANVHLAARDLEPFRVGQPNRPERTVRVLSRLVRAVRAAVAPLVRAARR
ncbi:MAG: hypothetical protein AAF125_19530 [Chloroflexota bacterium]